MCLCASVIFNRKVCRKKKKKLVEKYCICSLFGYKTLALTNPTALLQVHRMKRMRIMAKGIPVIPGNSFQIFIINLTESPILDYILIYITTKKYESFKKKFEINITDCKKIYLSKLILYNTYIKK